MAEKAWYVVQVTTGREIECRDRIIKSGIEAIAPTRIMPELNGGKWRQRERVMISGYVFIHADIDTAYYRLNGIPGTIRILPGNGSPEAVPEHQMKWIIWLANGGKPWGISTARKDPNGRTHILSGPMLGMEYKLEKWDRRRRRARIRIDVLDTSKIIELGLTEAETETAD